MKKLAILITLFLVSNLIFAQTADDVINNYVNAIGGKDNLDGIKSYTTKKSYKANASTDFNEEVNVIIADNKLSRKKTLMNRSFFYILNANNGWLKIPTGSQDKAASYTINDLGTNEKAVLSDEIKDGLVPFYNYAAKGYAVTANVSTANINNVECSTFEISKPNMKRTLYFDKSTGLLKREVIETNGVTTTIDENKYATGDGGFKYPSEVNLINTKDKRNTTVTTEIILNPSIDSSVFSK